MHPALSLVMETVSQLRVPPPPPEPPPDHDSDSTSMADLPILVEAVSSDEESVDDEASYTSHSSSDSINDELKA